MIGRLAALRSLPAPLAILAGMTFVSSLGISMMLPLLPLYGLALGATPVQLGLMTSAFAIANAVSQFGTGFLNDRFGPRTFIAAGIATYGAANALIAAAPSAGALIAFRAVAGFGAGANLVSARLRSLVCAAVLTVSGLGLTGTSVHASDWSDRTARGNRRC